MSSSGLESTQKQEDVSTAAAPKPANGDGKSSNGSAKSSSDTDKSPKNYEKSDLNAVQETNMQYAARLATYGWSIFCSDVIPVIKVVGTLLLELAVWAFHGLRNFVNNYKVEKGKQEKKVCGSKDALNIEGGHGKRKLTELEDEEVEQDTNNQEELESKKWRPDGAYLAIHQFIRKMFTAKENATEEADDTEEAEIFQDKLTDEGREKIQEFKSALWKGKPDLDFGAGSSEIQFTGSSQDQSKVRSLEDLAKSKVEVIKSKVEVTYSSDSFNNSNYEIFKSEAKLTESADCITDSKDVITESKEEISVSKEVITESKDLITEPREEMNGPREEITGPREEITGPREEMNGPREEITGPREEITEPREEITEPREEITEPREEITESDVIITKYRMEADDDEASTSSLNPKSRENRPSATTSSMGAPRDSNTKEDSVTTVDAVKDENDVTKDSMEEKSSNQEAYPENESKAKDNLQCADDSSEGHLTEGAPEHHSPDIETSEETNKEAKDENEVLMPEERTSVEIISRQDSEDFNDESKKIAEEQVAKVLDDEEENNEIPEENTENDESSNKENLKDTNAKDCDTVDVSEGDDGSSDKENDSPAHNRSKDFNDNSALGSKTKSGGEEELDTSATLIESVPCVSDVIARFNHTNE